MNLELMFPRELPYERRVEEAARCGAKHYGFWGYEGKNLDAMLDAQHKHGLTCVSLTGAPRTGWGSGLTKTGEEAAFLDDFEAACQVAKRFGAENLITFVGRRQPDIPWETQKAQVVAGLKKAGAVAEAYGVYLTLEPLNRVESPQMTMVTSAEAYEFAAGADHPRVKVDFDIYHRQLGEGNVTPTLEEGLAKGYVRFVEVGDVPGRKEPGTGDLNYVYVFNRLRRLGYAGAIGMEHGTTRTPQHAWDVVRAMAGLA
jgi:hydroxypyruvate isomerase